MIVDELQKCTRVIQIAKVICISFLLFLLFFIKKKKKTLIIIDFIYTLLLDMQ